MVVFGDGFGYCDFAGSSLKYSAPGSSTNPVGFQGTGTQTLTGSIDPGPFPGTSALHFKTAYCTIPGSFLGNQGWLQSVQLAATKYWIISLWINPVNITSRQTFLALQDSEVPNFNPKIVVHVNAGGRIEVVNQAPSGLRMNSSAGALLLTSSVLPQNAWTHICISLFWEVRGSRPDNYVRLYVNGNLDSQLVGGDFGGTASMPSRLSLCWQAPAGGAEILLSQIVACDNISPNNVPLPPSTQITTIFPSGDAIAGGWTPSPGYSQVNANPGPVLPAGTDKITLPSLAAPDELFSIPAVTTTDSNLALILNSCAQGASAQTYQGLVLKAGDSRRLLGFALAVPAAYATQQFIADTDPQTGNPWKDADISAAAFGVRGLTGTGEGTSQIFIEKIFSTGIGSYSY